MRRQKLATVALAIVALHPVILPAQNPQQLDVLLGTALASGLDLGINSSGGLTNWLTQEPPPNPPPTLGDLKMVCPGGQAWCAMFVTYGKPVDPPRPGVDLSTYQTLMVEIMGDPGTTIDIGIKDALQRDDGNEAKVTLPVTSTWTMYSIPLSRFVGANLKNIYVACEFVFNGGSQPQTVKVRTIRYTTASAPSLSAAQSAASFLTAVGANTWISVFGQNLSSGSRAWAGDDFKQNVLPTSLDGIQVLLNGRPMAVSYISPGQINALVFSDVPPGSAYLTVVSSLVTSAPLTVNVQSVFPGLFTLPQPNSKYAAAVAFSDSLLVAPIGALGAGVNTRPAKPGEIIELYGTGFGPTNPADKPGMLPAVPLPLAAAAQVFFGGVPSPSVSFAGLTAAGLYQFNVVVPNVANGDQPVVVRVGNATSQANVFVSIMAGS